jgi:hypothetical protein
MDCVVVVAPDKRCCGQRVIGVPHEQNPAHD